MGSPNSVVRWRVEGGRVVAEPLLLSPATVEAMVATEGLCSHFSSVLVASAQAPLNGSKMPGKHSSMAASPLLQFM